MISFYSSLIALISSTIALLLPFILKKIEKKREEKKEHKLILGGLKCIIAEIESQLKIIDRCTEIIKVFFETSDDEIIKPSLENLKVFSDFYSDTFFNNSLNSIRNLPSKFISDLMVFYRYSKAVRDGLKILLNEENHMKIYKDWGGMQPYLTRDGYKILFKIHKNHLKDKEKEVFFQRLFKEQCDFLRQFENP